MKSFLVTFIILLSSNTWSDNAEINKGVDFLKDFVQKKGTALGPRNKPITTATHIVQIAKFLTDKMKFTTTGKDC